MRLLPVLIYIGLHITESLSDSGDCEGRSDNVPGRNIIHHGTLEIDPCAPSGEELYKQCLKPEVPCTTNATSGEEAPYEFYVKDYDPKFRAIRFGLVLPITTEFFIHAHVADDEGVITESDKIGYFVDVIFQNCNSYACCDQDIIKGRTNLARRCPHVDESREIPAKPGFYAISYLWYPPQPLKGSVVFVAEISDNATTNYVRFTSPIIEVDTEIYHPHPVIPVYESTHTPISSATPTPISSSSNRQQSQFAAGPGPTRDTPTGPSPTRDTPTGPSPTRDTPTGPGPTRDTHTGPGPTRDTRTGPGPTRDTLSGPGPTRDTPSGPGLIRDAPTGPGPTRYTPSGPGLPRDTPTGPGPTRDTHNGPGPTRDAPSGPSPTRDTPTGPGPTRDEPTGPGPTRDTPSGPGPTRDTPTGPGPTRDTPTGPGPTRDVPTGPVPTRDAPNTRPKSGMEYTRQESTRRRPPPPIEDKRPIKKYLLSLGPLERPRKKVLPRPRKGGDSLLGLLQFK